MKNYSNYETRKVVITVDKNETLARIFNDNNEVVSTGVAKCNPEDTFDFKTGAELAMKRAFEVLYTPIEVISGKNFRKVSRNPKPGDYIRVIDTGYPFEKKGNIYRVHCVANEGRSFGVRNCEHFEHKMHFPDMSDNYIWWHGYTNGTYETLEEVK